MERTGLRFFFLVPLFLLLQLAAFGASAPSGSGGALKEEKGDPELKPSVEPSALIKSQSTQPRSGTTSLDSFQTSGHTEAKDSKNLTTETKNVDLPVSNSLVRDPDLNDPKHGENLQSNSQNADVPDPSPPKSHHKDSENVAPAAEGSQPHPSVVDSAAQNPDLNKAKQSGSLPVPESKDVKPVASVPESLNSNPKETKETENLSPSSENDPSGAAVPPHNSDHNEANQNEKLPEESKALQSDVSLVDPSRKSDHNEDNQSENSPEKSQTLQSDISVADSPSPKSDQKEASQNEKNLHSGEDGAESTPQKSDRNEANQKDSVPAVSENDLADTSAPKDEDVDDDSMIDDETIGGGKEGEETDETSPSEKEEVKNSPVGPSPKNESENSHFFAYLVTTAIVVAALYIAYHNKRKIIAFALEGKKSKVIRRPKSSDYQRLDQKI